jgi:hypothetical protein
MAKRKFLERASVQGRKIELSGSEFTKEATYKRAWQITDSRKTEKGIDYIIGKNEFPLNPEIQLRTTWMRREATERYSFQLHSWKNDLKKFFAYFVVRARAESEKELDDAIKKWDKQNEDGSWAIRRNFYIVPMSDIPKIERFKKALESGTWKKRKDYNATLTPEQIDKFLSEYEDEKGWALLEERAKKYSPSIPDMPQ